MRTLSVMRGANRQEGLRTLNPFHGAGCQPAMHSCDIHDRTHGKSEMGYYGTAGIIW